MIFDASECLYHYYLWVEKCSSGNSQQFALHQQIVLHHAAKAKESVVFLGHYFCYSSTNT